MSRILRSMHIRPVSLSGRPTRLWTVLLVLLAVGVAGCASYLQPFETAPPSLTPRTSTSQELRSLPAPREPVVVAVYRFRDQTGQYRALENMSTFSTAVTQGSTSILIRALEDSGWFVPIEREGLSNLLNERQIVQGIRAQHLGPDGEPLGPLPPLLYAGVLLEGGIIGYDSNVLTHGAGLRYFGAGGSGSVRQDQVTVYIRAVSTQSGRVLKTVYTTKSILSQRLEGGVFRFVALRRMLEAEAGYSFNEPPVLAVTEAIEEAVRALVLEGVKEGLWGLADPNDINHPAFASHEQAVAEAENMDSFQRLLEPDRPKGALGLTAGGLLYQGDFMDPLVRPSAAAMVRYPLTGHLDVEINMGGGQLAAGRSFETGFGFVDAGLRWNLLPRRPVTPFFGAGVGAIMQPDSPRDGGTAFLPFATAGGGVEVRVAPTVSIMGAGSFNYMLVDGIDGVISSGPNDSFYGLRAGIIYYTPMR